MKEQSCLINFNIYNPYKKNATFKLSLYIVIQNNFISTIHSMKHCESFLHQKLKISRIISTHKSYQINKSTLLIKSIYICLIQELQKKSFYSLQSYNTKQLFKDLGYSFRLVHPKTRNWMQSRFRFLRN